MHCETSRGWGKRRAAGHWQWEDRTMYGCPFLALFSRASIRFQSIHLKPVALLPKYAWRSLKSSSFWSVTVLENILNNHFSLTLIQVIWYNTRFLSNVWKCNYYLELFVYLRINLLNDGAYGTFLFIWICFGELRGGWGFTRWVSPPAAGVIGFFPCIHVSFVAFWAQKGN